ncbi:MAG: Chitinase-3-like protein 2 [Cirrosporium novae-zelandiae]|nr:MAG: Chitinase-3-like protein 2 [Cirrosporium novae-zelandiae]
MAFQATSLFLTNPHGTWDLFENVTTMRARFDEGTKVLVAIGGWGDTGFSTAAANETMRKLFAKNVAAMLNETGADGVDIDWEYPGGNGADYKTVSNADKVSEITTFPLLMKEIRNAIGWNKLLTVATPGLERDMIAFTNTTMPKIVPLIDFMNIMTYDLLNRRDNVTAHHTPVVGSLEAVDRYLDLGLPASKANLGFAFYAKYFSTDPASDCATQPLGCTLAALENADGTDNGKSGSMTFETVAAVPDNMTVSTDGTCGASVAKTCPTGNCCSQYDYCGATSAYCSLSCQPDYGTCNGSSALGSWRKAQNNSITDTTLGGEYYWDSDANLFWTWDTPALIARKFSDIVQSRGIGGIMAWSLGEDSDGWTHLSAMSKGAEEYGLLSNSSSSSSATAVSRKQVRHGNHGRMGHAHKRHV